ncbi:hypothetical protein, partial [Stenotrophomonas sp. CC120223-11]|uniref:hypothetical protein n=1 Tax=Stenotrophomonas sp. CC120223-11 TaxID=1378090 RepID=UPI001C3E9EF6
MLDIPSGKAVGVSENGTIIVGTVGEFFPYSIYWTEGSPPENMGYLRGGSYTKVSAVSGSRPIAVGAGITEHNECTSNHAFRWRKDSRPQMEDLGVPDGYDDSYATDLNDDGTIIVGHCHRDAGGVDAFYWDESSGTRRIIKLTAPQGALENSTRLCRANGSNKDGTLIVGDCKLENGSTQAVCWLGNTRTVITLPLLENGIRAQANAVSSLITGHDNVIVGECTVNPSITHAVRWKRIQGTRTFYIENLNVLPEPRQNSWFSSASGVSRDGTVIVGGCSSGETPGTHDHSDAFIWIEYATPKVHKLKDAFRYVSPRNFSAAHDVTKKPDGTTIAVGLSSFRPD